MTRAAPVTVFESPDDLIAAAPCDLGSTAWFVVGIPSLVDFASATGAAPPSSGEPLPPYMLVSLTNRFLPELLEVRGVSSGVNYGTGKIRFGPPARPGEQIRASATLTDAAEVSGGVQTTVEIRIEADGAGDPACVVESISRWLR